MISLDKACEIATKANNEPYISSIFEVQSGYVIVTMAADGCVADDSPTIISKDTGEVAVFFPPEHAKELKSGKPLDVPGKYCKYDRDVTQR